MVVAAVDIEERFIVCLPNKENSSTHPSLAIAGSSTSPTSQKK
jgi:hypothetical protein